MLVVTEWGPGVRSPALLSKARSNGTQLKVQHSGANGGGGDPQSSLASRSSRISGLCVQWETLSPKLRWTALEKHTWHQPWPQCTHARAYTHTWAHTMHITHASTPERSNYTITLELFPQRWLTTCLIHPFPMQEPNRNSPTNAGAGHRLRVSAVWQWRGLLKHLIILAKLVGGAKTFILLSSLNYSIPSKIHCSSTAVPWPLETIGDLFGRWKCFSYSCLPIWKIIICALFILKIWIYFPLFLRILCIYAVKYNHIYFSIYTFSSS